MPQRFTCPLDGDKVRRIYCRSIRCSIGGNELDMADAQGLGNFIKRDDRRIAQAALQAAQILLTDAAALFDLLLRQAFFPTKAREIPADQFAHIHALEIAVYIL